MFKVSEDPMKYLSVLLVTMALTACGTVGGALSGAGDDLKSVGGMIAGKGRQ